MTFTPPANTALTEVLGEFQNAPSLTFISDRIERLDMSADAKSLMMDLARVTVKVGGTVVAIGRKIIEFVFALAKRFPNTLFGLIMALVLSMVIATIPFLGGVIAAILTPIMLAFGLGGGAMQDFKEAGLRAEIDALSQKMNVMAAHVTAA